MTMKTIINTLIVAAIIALSVVLTAAPTKAQTVFTGDLTVTSTESVTLIDYVKAVGFKVDGETKQTLEMGMYTFSIESATPTVWQIACDGVAQSGASFMVAIHIGSDIHCDITPLAQGRTNYMVYMPIVAK